MLRLKQLRTEKELSQQKLADMLGITQPAVNNYENGNYEPDIATLKLYATFFNTSIDYILGYSDHPNKVEITTECHLNGAELLHITLYRKLPTNVRSAIDNLMNDIMSMD